MSSNSYEERYRRQLQLPGFGPEAQQLLQDAHVAVIGAGGLGVPVLQYLTGMGIGELTIVDGDCISVSNLHRQVLYGDGDVGLNKAIVAERQLRALNPHTRIRCVPVMLTTGNALNLLKGCDVVVDATDAFSARYLINDACVMLGKPFVYGAVHQFEGQVSTFNFRGGPTYRCLYPVPPAAMEIPDCNTAGVLGVVPALVGCRQALEVVRLLTGTGENLSGQLLIFDFRNDAQYRIALKANPENQRITALQPSYDGNGCGTAAQPVSPETLEQWYRTGRTFLLVDVRAAGDFAAFHLPGAVNRPLSALDVGFRGDTPDKSVVLYCQRGVSSARAAVLLQSIHPELTLYELTGGLDAWNQAGISI